MKIRSGYAHVDWSTFKPSKANWIDKAKVWFTNSLYFHHRLMAKYLENRGWVVFYLNKQSRSCGDTCWLKLYESGRK